MEAGDVCIRIRGLPSSTRIKVSLSKVTRRKRADRTGVQDMLGVGGSAISGRAVEEQKQDGTRLKN